MKYKKGNKMRSLMDDYNIEFSTIESHGPCSDYHDTMYSNGFISLIAQPTRDIISSATLIDSILLSSQLGESLQGILVTDDSGH